MARYEKYVPDYLITINGSPLPAELRAMVTSVSHTSGMKGSDRVEVVFANPNLRLLEHELFWIDNSFKLSLGYAPDPLEELFVGEITGVEPSFPNGGMPTMTIVAQDFLNRLTQGTKNRSFHVNIPGILNGPLPDVVVASIVAATNLLIPYPDPVGGALSLIMGLTTYVVSASDSQKAVSRQQKISDFAFLTEIAKKNGWEMYIDHSLDPKGYVLRFQFLIQDYSPSQTLEYGSSLNEFTPKITTVGDVFGVAATLWVDAIKTEFVLVVSWDYDRAAFNLSIYPNLVGNLDDMLGASAKGGILNVTPTGLAQTVPEILGKLLPRLNNRLTGSGSVIGDPAIKPGMVIDLKGLGEQFSGMYRVTSVTHTIDSGGFRTNFSGRKEVWFGSIPIPKGVGGLVRMQGQSIG